MKRVLILAAMTAAFMASPALAATTTYQVQPSKLDPGVKAFDDPSVIIDNSNAPKAAPLVIFLTGTSGKAAGPMLFLGTIADLGYRVVSLEYDDEPAVSQVCPQNPDPDCSEAFRRMRVDGEGQAVVSNPAAESITVRLTLLLAVMAKKQPNAGWDQYLDGNQPRWDRIVVSGLSQGAGMAAYIAKHHEVARVVLFSSPWDVTGRDHHPVPWLSQPSATPMDRWFAEYHEKEATAKLIQNAYAALQIPADHIRVFTHDIPSDFHGTTDNPYHVNTIRDQRYKPDWKIMYGTPAPDGSIQTPQ